MGQRPKYDRAFKEQTVQKILNKEATITEMSHALIVHYITVRDWVRA